MQKTLTRRSLLGRVGVVVGTLATAPIPMVEAADPPHVSLSDPIAQALGYTEDASKVDPHSSPNYQAGDKCANCLQDSGPPGQTWGPCKIFAGKLVNTNGWCRAYVKKA